MRNSRAPKAYAFLSVRPSDLNTMTSTALEAIASINSDT